MMSSIHLPKAALTVLLYNSMASQSCDLVESCDYHMTVV